MNKIISTEFYQALIEELDAIIGEKGKRARMELNECYHEVGTRILQDWGNFEREKIYGEGIVNSIAKSLRTSKRNIYYSIAFARKFPDLNMLPGGSDQPWSKVVKLLTESKNDVALPALPSNEKLEKIMSDYLPWLVETLSQNKKGIVLFFPYDKLSYELENGNYK